MMAHAASPSCSSESKQRETWIDCVRVLAIFLIIVYHLRPSMFVHTGISSMYSDTIQFLFNKPSARLSFFFLLAGYFMRAQLSYRHWGMRIGLLLCAYIIWNSICAVGPLLYPSLAASYGFDSWAEIYGVGSSSKFCIDYPLWFVRDLIVMMLFVPLMRFYPLIWAGVLLMCAYWHGGKHWVIADVFAMPEFSFWCLFVLGMYCTRFSLAAIRQLMPRWGLLILLLWPLLLFHKAYVASADFYRDPAVLVLASTYSALLLISLGHAIWYYLPARVSTWVNSFAPASFLAFAWHAIWILCLSMAVKLIAPELLYNHVLIFAIPFLIMWVSRATDRMLTRRFPRLAMLCCNKVPKRR